MITEALKQFPNQKPKDRSNIVTGVFNLKLKELTKDIKQRKIFGNIIAGKICFFPMLFVLHLSLIIYQLIVLL